MKKTKLLPIAALGAICATMVVGCAQNDPLDECFSTYSTVKVSQNADHSAYYEKLPAKIEVSMMQNESEAGQVVFKFNKDISNFTVEVSDLVSKTKQKISKDNVTVYMQRYLTLDKDLDNIADFPTGTSVPDFLLPVQYAISSKENSIKKDQYQGFVADIKTDADTAGGVYSGTITFTFDGVKKEIPVSVTVWGFKYSGTREMKSSFLVYRSALVGGEYEASDETIQNYTDMLTDYKVNAMVVENPSKYNASTMKDYVDNQVRMIDANPNYSSIPLPVVNIPRSFTVGDIPSNRDSLTESGKVITMMYDLIHNLVLHSSDDVNYVKYAYFYLTNFDEMDMYTEKDGSYERGLKFFAKGGYLDQVLQKIVDKISSDGELVKFNAVKREEMIQSILKINRVNPLTTFNSTIVETLNQTSCPYISQLENSEYYSRYDYNRDDNSNGDLWTYTCVGPKAPYPTFHLDDYNLGSRTTGWTMKRRNVTGYLYYAVNIYDEQNDAANGAFIDPYTAPTRNADCPGDGFLIYPGRKYGSDRPFPSNRLLCFRDGMDDYDLLSVYEREISTAERNYGVSFDYESMMNEVYDSVITNALYVNDDKAVLSAREEVANRILALTSDDNLIVNSYISQGKVNTEIYSLYNALSVNGETLTSVEKSGRGYKAVYQSSLGEEKDLKILGMTSSLNYHVSSKGNVSGFADNTGVSVSEGCSFEAKDGKLVCAMNSVDKGSANANKRFKLYADVKNDALSGVSGIDFTIKNDGEYPLSINLTLDGFTSTYLRSIYLYPGQESRYHYNFALETEEKLSKVSGIKFELENFNAEDNDIYRYARNFTISDFTYYK